MRYAGRRIAAPVALLSLLALGLRSAAEEEPASAPADPAGILAPLLVEFEKIRVSADPQPARVAAVLRDALAAVDKIDAASKDTLDRFEAGMYKDPRKPPSKAVVAERQRLRTLRAQAALLRGDVYRLAATALPPGHADRATNLHQSIQVFGALRVEYRDLGIGFLGYVGEARAQRAAGNLDAAYAALKPVLNLAADPQDAASQDIRRTAAVELLEVHLAADPKRAIAEADNLRLSAAFVNAPAWQARVDYVAARARAAELERLASAKTPAKDAGDRAAAAAAILRREAVLQIAPLYDRLRLLADLDRLAGGGRMTRDELIQWADVLAATGRSEAVAVYRRAQESGPLAPEKALLYLSLLVKQGEFTAVAQVSEDLLKRLEPAHPQQGTVLQWRAIALLKLLEQAGAQPPSADLQARALAALRAVFESTLEPAVRRDALSQWVAIQCRMTGPGDCLDTLLGHQDLVADDPYLQYTQAAGQWQRLVAEMAAGDVEDSVAGARARAIADALGRIPKPAAPGASPHPAARAALLKAQILSDQPLKDSRAALAVLTAEWNSLQSEAETAQAAGWLRVELLMDLGMVSAASKALADLPDTAAPNSPPALLRLAEALASRLAGAAPDALADARREILRLCERAMGMTVSNAETFLTLSQRSARTMLRVGAYADAERVLSQVLASEPVKADPKRLLDDSLAMAEALRGLGRTADAMKLLDQLAGRSPDSVALHLARSRCQLALRQPEQAVASARRARALAKPGEEDWCETTLVLAEGLSACDHGAAAADILRVSDALYPTFGNLELRRRMKQMRQDLAAQVSRADKVSPK